MSVQSQISINDLEESLDYLALVIDVYGTKYLPLFEKVQTELEARLNRKSALDLAAERVRRIRQNDTHFDTQTDTHA